MSYFSLYQFATKWDVFLILIGIIFTILKAATQPLLILAYSEFTTLLIERTMGIGTSSSTTFLQLFGGGRVLTNASVEENNTEMKNDSIAFGIFVGLDILIFFICGIGGVDCFNRTAFRQITRIRTKYFQSLIRQEVAYYDVAGDSNNFAARITEDIEKIQEGIAEKVSHYLYLMIASVISIIVSFTYGWELSLVMISYVPIVIITIIVTGKFRVKLLTKEGNAYSAAANVAEEVLSGIRTVFAFGGEQLEIERYKKQLIKERKAALVAKGWLAGFCVGVMRFLFFGSNALGFWYGVKLVLDDRDKTDKEYTPKILMNTFLGLLVGAENIAKTAPFIDTFATARSSAAAIFNVINRTSKIDSMSNDGNVLKVGVKRSILFKNVFFSYPSRPDVPILRGLDLEIQPGQSLALVGGSGNGKSTCLQLLQRFYDPNEGQVLIDGYDIRKLNINKLRSNIATVGQEPILFSTTIGENIRYGKPDASDKDIVAAAKMSGAHAFIVNLPLGYNTLVGEKGSQLSGGQKQRIAIARAMIQNPKILLLDEATSALDYQSEKLVQETLDKVSQGRTTITVSHRLSAIRNADRIVFLDKGVVVEDGTHSQLMVQKGRYYEMITAGRLKDENEDEIEDEHQPVYNNFIENPIYMSAHPNNGPPVTISTPIINASPFFNDQNVAESYFRSVRVDVNERKVKDESDERIQYRKVFKRIFTLIKPQWFTVLLAVIFACFVGAILPTFAIIFGDIYGSLSNKDSNKVLDDTIDDCIMFVVMGIVAFFAILLQSFFFSKASFDLATRVRSMTFAAFMRQECSWFDEKNHSSAALSARLTGDVANLQEIFGNPLSMVFQSLSTFVAGIVIAFIYSWKLSLVCLIALPLAALTVFLDAKHRSKRLFEEKQSIEVGTKIASEAITNIRTVASLRQEKYMIERYVAEMKKASSTVRKSIVWRGLVNSTAQSIPYFGYTISLTYGGFLIANGEIEYGNVIKVAQALLLATVIIGQMFVFIPVFTAAFVGVHRIIQTIDRVPMINSPIVNNKSRKPDKSNNIDFKNIDFRYPTRPDVQILDNFNLNVMEGKTIALVGPSGCGKSTCIQLLQRLYDPEHGRIHVGLDEISSDISIEGLRSKLSIVSQEPVLFDKTIAENIAYGDNSREVSMEEIIDAARMANVHDFIAQLPLGYETNVGSTSQFSGGQKQRIAIARALIRNPKILLLDEATSALDLHSEQLVQQALDSARSCRTCLVIAHRLSTVQNADAICVVRGGNIVEYGTHDELLALNGIYTRLYNSQK